MKVEAEVAVEELFVEVEVVLVREVADRVPLEESRSLLYSRWVRWRALSRSA